MDVACEAALEKRDPVRKEQRREKRSRAKQAQSSDPKSAQGKERIRARSRYVPAPTKAIVLKRAGYCCEYQGKDGKRCGSKQHLEIDHIKPYALGGGHESENLQVLCGQHNGLRARETFGDAASKWRRTG